MRALHWITSAAVACSLSCGPSGTSATKTTPPPATDPPAPDAGPAAPGDMVGIDAPAPWATSGVDWSKPPAPTAEPTFAPPAAKRFELSNGLKVVVIENRSLPLVSLQLVNPYGGALYDPRRKYGLAAMTADLMDESAGGRTALELADHMQRLGAAVWVGAGDDYGVANLRGLSRTFDESLAVFADVVMRPAFVQTDFDRVKSNRVDSIKQNRDEPRAVASMAFHQTLYGADAPYGWPTEGRASTVAKLRRKDVQRFHAAHWRPNGATLFVAGDVDADTLAPVLEASLGSWKRGAPPRKVPAIKPVETPARLVMIHSKDDAPQSAVYIGRVALARDDARYYVAEVLNTALGGTFASRLNNRLREQLGYTYGAGSSFDYGVQRGTWRVRTDLVADKTIPGIKEALAIVRSVVEAPLPDDELARSRALLVRGFPQKFQSNAGVAAAYAELVVHGLPDDWYASYVDRIGQVTAADAHAFAQDMLAANDFVVVVVGDVKAQRAALLDLGLRPAIELDRDGKVLAKHK